MNKQKSVNEQVSSARIPFWRQLRWNLIFYSIVLVLLPVVIVVAFTLAQVRSLAVTQVVNQLQSVSTLKQEALTEWLKNSNLTIDTLLANNDTRLHITYFAGIQTNLPESVNSMNQLLADALKTSPDSTSPFIEYFLYNAEGRILASSNSNQVGKVVTRQPYFTPSLTGNIVQSPYYEIGSSSLTMLMTRRLTLENGTVLGVLAGRLDLDVLSNTMLNRSGLGETGETYLVSVENNYFLTPSRFEGFTSNQAYHSEGIDAGLAGQTNSGVYPDYRNIPVIGVYTWLPDLKAAMLSEIDEAEALAPFTQTTSLSVIIAGLAALVAGSIAFYNATRLSNPITALTRIASQIASGNLRQRAQITEKNEIGVLANTFNQMAEQLQEFISSLEGRVAERTRDLATSIEVGQLATSIYGQEQLLPALVDFIREQFSLYYTQIYLLDEAKRYATLRAGTGEVGQQLLERKHRLDLSQTSLVASAVENGQPVLVADTDKSSVHRKNPLLPNTRSEVAIPLIVGNDTLGVLDMQSEQPNTFNEDNLPVFRAMATQIASVLRSARAYDEVQEATRRAQVINERLTNQNWSGYLGRVSQQGSVGYQYDLEFPRVLEDGFEFISEPDKTTVVQPIVLRGAQIGNIMVKEDGVERQFGEAETALIQDVADRVAQSLEQYRAFDETQRRLRDVQTSNKIAEYIRADADLETLVEDVLNVVLENFNADNAVYSRFDDRAQVWRGVAGAGTGMTTEIAKSFIDPVSRYPHAVAALRTADVVAVNDASRYPDFPPEFLDEKIGVKSVLVLPVTSGATVTGVMFFNFNSQYHNFTTEELSLARGLANQISSGIQRKLAEEQVRLYVDVVNNAPSGMLVYHLEDLNNPLSLRLVAANRASMTSTQVDPTTIVGKTLPEAFPTIVDTGLPDVYAEVARSGKTVDLGDNRFDNPDGSTLIFAIKAFGLPNNSVGVSIEDVTDRRLEQEERQILLEAANSLNSARNPKEILQVIMPYSLSEGMDSATMLFIENDADGNPEWAEIVSTWQSSTTGVTIGDRYYLPEFPFSKLWMSTPSEIRIVQNVETDPEIDEVTRQVFKQANNLAAVIMPLYLQGRWIGLIVLSWDKPTNFSERDRRIYTAIMRQAAPTLDALRSEANTRQAREDAEILYRFTVLVNEATNEQDLTNALVENTKSLNPFAVALVLFENNDFKDANYVRVASDWRQEGPTQTGLVIPLAHFPFLKHADPRQVTFSTDVVNDPKLDEASKQAFLRFGTAAYILVPLSVAERWAGVFVISHHEAHVYTERDVRFLRSVAGQTTSAVDRINLTRQTENRATELATAALVSTEAATKLEIEDLLWSVANLTKEKFNRYHAHIYLMDEETDNLILVAGAGEAGREMVANGHRIPFHQERSLVARAARTRVGVIVNNTEIDPHFLPNPLLPETKAEMAIPMIAEGSLIGVLDIQDKKTDAFNETSLQVKTSLANQIAVAIQNANVFKEVQQAESDAEALYHFTVLVNEAQSEGDLTNALVEHTKALNPFAVAMVLFENNNYQNATYVRVASDWRREGSTQAGLIIPLAHFPFLKYANANEITMSTDVPNDTRIDEISKQGFLRFGAVAYILVPLAIAERWVGIFVISHNEPHIYHERDIRFLRSVAGQTTSAVDRITLTRQTERRASELATVAEVSAATTSELDVEKLLNQVSELTKARFNLYHAHIYLLDEDKANLVLRAGAGEAGRVMRERGHSIPLSREHSLVARAARSRESVISNNVTQEPDFLPNPLLPDTRSELAIPMIVGDNLLGVLDVQANAVNRFTSDDVAIQSTLADQIAVAVQNAQAYQIQLETAERLREVDRLKSQFLANMSHELRTPLNSILGYAEVLLDGIDGDLSDEAVEDVEAIHQGGKHLLTIINDILDLAKIEAGQMVINPVEADVMDVIGQVIDTCKILAQNKNIMLEVHENGDIPKAYGDPIRLKQIILNLVNNAIKFTNEGGVTVEVGAHNGSEVGVWVKDTGIGMTPDEMGGLFQQFHQVDGSATRRAGGTGLGLVISRHLVHMHEGEIYVESEKGKGSTFWFTVPAFQAVHEKA